MNKLVYGIVVFAASMIMIGCEDNTDNDVLSSDLVKNPVTASSEKSDTQLANMTFSN